MAKKPDTRQIIRHLFVCGASPVIRDCHGDTPLHLACREGNISAVYQLIIPVETTELMQAQACYNPSITEGILAADRSNYDGE